MIAKLSSEVEASAKQTLHAIGRSFGARSLEFVFKPTGESKVHVSVGEKVEVAA